MPKSKPSLDDLISSPEPAAPHSRQDVTAAPGEGGEGEPDNAPPNPLDAALGGRQGPEPMVVLPPAAYDDLLPLKGSFSDDPPADWTDNDPVTGQLDPVAAARRSLLEDAARARGVATPLPANVAVPVQRRGSRIPEIRQALSRAARVTANMRYRSRIAIAAAYQYDGRLHLAPDYIDRNWIAYQDGPALDVPDVGLVKQGQWLVIQDVLGDDGTLSFSELKVYDDAVFRALFMAEAPP